MNFNTLFYSYLIRREGTFLIKEVTIMFLGLEWYWWLVILAVLIISVPFKVKFIKWWGRREQGKKKRASEKWGDDE